MGKLGGEVDGVDIVDVLKFLQQVIVVLLAHVVVGYAKYQLASESTLDGEHAIIEQQTWENLSFRNLVGRERLIELGDNLSFLGDLVDDATTLAIEFVELQEFLHLAIVGLGIGVDHNSWGRPLSM